MMKIIVLQGVPACGKSTWARQFAQEHKDYVIVCRDSIREGTGVYWVPEREDYISKLEKNAISEAINSGLNVIIDATNLNPKTIQKWNDLAVLLKADIEYKKFEISYEEALKRDAEREKNGGRAVGVKVIRDFFKRYFPEKLSELTDSRPIKSPEYLKSPVILSDIDRTIALRNNRSPYDLTKVSTDTFDPRMRRLLTLINQPIIFVSGREETEQSRKDTEEWLKTNLPDLHGWKLLMRKPGDYRNDAIIKQEIYEKQIEPLYDVICVFDDRDRVVTMWRDKGILCNQVYYGNF